MNTLEPSSIDEAQALMRGLQQKVMFVGGGTQLGLGPAPEVLLRTTRLNRIVDYAPSDQVVTVEAGVTLQALQQALHEHGQRLSLDPPLPERATLGGIVAANSFGPLRARFGAVRDLIIGVSILRADGTRAKGGGRVVKTVAGFDLPKLMCGSLGTLGLIVTATFRVHPLPQSEVTLVARGVPTPGVFALVKAMRAAQLEPTAMVATRGGASWEVAVRFEGFDAGVQQQREKLRTLGPFEVSADPVWAAHAAQRTAGDVRLKVAALPSQLEQVAQAFSADFRLCWYPTLGLGFALRDGDCDLSAVRGALAALGGSLTVEAAPAGHLTFGPPPDSLRVHQLMKARFDPQGLLAPGRFIGGI